MAKWPGVGERIRQRLIAVGYEKNGRPDILRFCMEKKFFPTYAYKWANASVLPERENLLRLAECLGVSPSWLLFGEPPQVATPPLKRKAPTKSSGRRGRGEILRKVGHKMVARALLRPVQTAARGTRRRVA